jgi:hypothetical protein
LLSLSPIAGQYLTFDGTNFDFLIPPTAPVTSVNGQTGVVSLDTDDVPEGSRLYFTEERVDDRVNNLLVAGANITLTYDDPSNSLTIAAASGSGSIPDGTAALPGLAFTSDPDTGLYRPGANQLGFATGGAERFRIEETGQLKSVYESTVGTDYNTTLHNGYLCRAWVNFDGTGTVAIRASGNVSSITDNETGDYTVNFTTAMPDANYSVCLSGRFDPGFSSAGKDISVHNTAELTVSSVRLFSNDASNSAADCPIVSLGVFR